jgi:hypothetical protein
MIDVIQHIVKEEKLAEAMRHIRESLLPGGVFILSAVHPARENKKHLWYVRFWSESHMKSLFPGHEFGTLVTHRDSHMLTIRRPR